MGDSFDGEPRLAARRRTDYAAASGFLSRASGMSDPLSDTIERLQPRAVFSRVIEGAGDWAVRYGTFGQPAFTVILAGESLASPSPPARRRRLAVDGHTPLALQAGDLVLLPANGGASVVAPCP